MYYPKSQIQTNLYTNGEEFAIKGQSSYYIGYYWKTSQGKYYTGKTPDSGENLILVSNVKEYSDNYTPKTENEVTVDSIIIFDEEGFGDADRVYSFDLTMANEVRAMQYENARSITPQNQRRIPQYYKTLPPSNAQVNYLRYFAKQNNAPIFIETSKETYNKFSSNDPMMATDLYTILPVPWSIEENASLINRFTVNKIEKENQWYGFHYYFKGVFDNTESISESLYTNGGEFLLPNRTNYIGFYHFMPNGTAMTGKNHGDKPEIILISIVNRPNINTESQPVSSTTTATPQLSYSPPASSGGGGGGY